MSFRPISQSTAYRSPPTQFFFLLNFPGNNGKVISQCRMFNVLYCKSAYNDVSDCFIEK